MAIYYLATSLISRGAGRTAVAAAAYRSATNLTHRETGTEHTYAGRRGVVHAEIVLPAGVTADWARDREGLWNAAEAAERRKDSRTAREIVVALPHELSADERTTLTRAYAQHIADRFGVAVDIAVHEPLKVRSIANHHAHLLITTRQVLAAGFGEKASIERSNAWLLKNDLPTSGMQLKDLRLAWEEQANAALTAAGFEVRIDCRSNIDRGLGLTATEHMGVAATHIDERGGETIRKRVSPESSAHNVDLITRKPEQILTLVTGEKSVFDRHDVARHIHRLTEHHPDAFSRLFTIVMASPELRKLPQDIPAPNQLEVYSTREMIELEGAMADRVAKMAVAATHGVAEAIIEKARRQIDQALKADVAAKLEAESADRPMLNLIKQKQIDAAGLSSDQVEALRSVTAGAQITTAVGIAGAGKSTMLAAARQAWVDTGYKVHGAALSGKAADGLEQSSRIASRTLASWELAWEAGKDRLNAGDVFVLDEAGMVGSRQMARLVEHLHSSGAKLVAIGDHAQLQAIGAGSPFRWMTDTLPTAHLTDVRRQVEGWQRQATSAFSRHDIVGGLAAYAERGCVHGHAGAAETKAALIKSVLADMTANPTSTRAVLAHRRVDVRTINDGIRSQLDLKGEVRLTTSQGQRAFAPKDRLVFLRNDRMLGVRNGSLGAVTAVTATHMAVRLDHPTPAGARDVTIELKAYDAVDHGYAVTIHKSQGDTVDRTFLLASSTMTREMTYVGATRHRLAAHVFYDQAEFKDVAALSASLGRDGSKETTLDYTKQFAARRGLNVLGVESEIVAPPAPVKALAQPAAVVAPAAVKPRSNAAAIAAQVQEWLEAEANWIEVLRAQKQPSSGRTFSAGFGETCQAIHDDQVAELERLSPGLAKRIEDIRLVDPVMKDLCHRRSGASVLERVEARHLRPADERAREFVTAWGQVSARYLDASHDVVRGLRALQGQMVSALAKEADVLARLAAAPAAFGVRPGSKLEAALQQPQFEQSLRRSIEQFQSYSHSRGFSR